MVYILVYMMILFIYMIYRQGYLNKKHSFILVFISMLLFCCLRGNGDGDYFSYKKYASEITDLFMLFNNNYPVEFGFRFISYIINLLQLDMQFIIIFMGIISLGSISYVIYKLSPDPLYSLILYFPIFLMFDMHSARSAIAISLCSIAIYNLINKKNILFFTFCFFATLFHKSSFIFIVFYLIKDIRISFKKSILFILFSYIFVIFIGIDNIVLFIAETFFRDGYLYNRILDYVNNEKYGYSFSLFDPRLLMSILIYFSSYLIVNKCKLPNSFNYLKNLLFLGIIIMIIFSFNTLFTIRFSYLFLVYYVILYPIIIKYIDKDNKVILGIKINYFIIFFNVLYFLYTLIICLKQVQYILYLF